jgi:ketosteroid isomerase-like protein
MSQENVEFVRVGFEAWNAGDMDALRDFLDPDVVQRNPEGWPEPGPLVGREAVMRNWEQARELFDTDTVEPISDFIDAGDQVVVRTTWRGAGRGPEAHLEWTFVVTLRDGRAILQEFFWDHAEALEAVGLSD